MKTYIFLVAILIAIGLSACGTGSESSEKKDENTNLNELYPDDNETSDNDNKGIGKFKDVVLPETLNGELADKGNGIYDLKCSACHRLEGDRLVGPSWKGVTERREPSWILNFVTNVDEMLNSDPAAMAQLEECLVRMPNQNLSDDDAYAVLEYMRKNDGVK